MSAYKKNQVPVGLGIMAVTISRLVLFFALMASAFVASAESRVSLKAVDFTSLPGDEIEIKATFDGAISAPTGYVIEKPARISLDLPGVKNALAEKVLNLGNGNARTLTVVDNSERARLIVSLGELTGYSTRVEGNKLYITVGKGQHSAPSTVGAVKSVKSAEKAIAGVDFRRGDQGDGQLLIDLSVPGVAVDVKQQGSRIVAKFVGAKLPERLRRRLDVTDFATPVKSVDVSSDGDNAVLVIQPVGEFEYLAYQADNKFTISVKPVTQESKRKKDAFNYAGEKLSLNFQDIDVRSVLQLIADFTSMNLVASDTVSGKITLRLQNVPWDQALDLILKTKGLDKRTVGNVMLVAPADEIAKREQRELESNTQAETLAPLRSEYIQLNYAKATDILPILTGERKMLSSRGSAVADPRTNMLVVYDTSKKIDELRELINRLDVPVRQVMIESRIVLASNNFAKELGVRWGQSKDFTLFNSGKSLYHTGGSTTTLWDYRNGWADATDKNGDGILDPKITITRPDDLVVDLGVQTAGATSWAIGLEDRTLGMIDLELSALQSDGHGEVISSPRVLTGDNQKATISSGQKVPYTKPGSNGGAPTTEYVDAVLELSVTPSITPDGRILMDLSVSKNSVDGFQGNAPIVGLNEVKTKVLVNDGETVVLGGIFNNAITKGVTKTPFFGDLPFIGRLFRKTTERNDKQELLIFVTPRISSEAVAAK